MSMEIFKFEIGEGDAAKVYYLTTKQAIKIIGCVYGFDTESLFRKPAKSVQYWLKQAQNSKKLTVKNLFLIEAVLEKDDSTHSIFARLWGCIK